MISSLKMHLTTTSRGQTQPTIVLFYIYFITGGGSHTSLFSILLLNVSLCIFSDLSLYIDV